MSAEEAFKLVSCTQPLGDIWMMPAAAPSNHARTRAPSNLLITALPEAERLRLVSASREVRFRSRDQITQQRQPVDTLYFPVSALVSLVTVMLDGSTVEMATIGREGVVGLPMVFRSESRFSGEAVTQIAGTALKLPATRFMEILEQSRRLPILVDRFSEALFELVAQNSACHRLHHAEQRLCRMLLTAHDGVEGDDIPLTHEFLGQMLGVRRASVSEAAEDLQARGVITYSRGRIRVTDREGLEKLSCECFRITQALFVGLYN